MPSSALLFRLVPRRGSSSNAGHALPGRTAARGKCTVLRTTDIARTCREVTRSELARLAIRPNLRGILLDSAAAGSAAANYIRSTARASAELGTGFKVVRAGNRSQLENAIQDANGDPSVHGVIVYYPLGLGERYDRLVQDKVRPCKDAEGLGKWHRRKWQFYESGGPMRGHGAVFPCTPLAVMKILEFAGVYDASLPLADRLRRRTVTVINRSAVVGRPLAVMLAGSGATVRAVDARGVFTCQQGSVLRGREPKWTFAPTVSWQRAVRLSDVVISGVPSGRYRVPSELIREGAVVVNVACRPNFLPDVTSRASVYVADVGPVTVAMLQSNVLRLAAASQAAFTAGHG